jgi:hypothetical protein
MEVSEALAQVIRVTRRDTVMIRTPCIPSANLATIYLVLNGVTCKRGAQSAILDWVELHQDGGRLKLAHADWFRDSFGRLLGDLIDRNSGETLTQYLIEAGVAVPRPNHYADLIEQILRAQEPE